MPAFSPQAITALVQVVTGGSGNAGGSRIGHYRTGAHLEMFFGNLGLDLHIGMNGRVPAVRNLLTTINLSPDGREQLVPAFEAAASALEYASDPPGQHEEALNYLNLALRADGCELVEHSGRYRLLAVGAQSAAAASVRETADALDLDTVLRHLDDALATVSTRPDAAIRSACSTLESVCSTILTRLGVPLPTDRSITPLYSETARALNLSLDREDLSADIRRILGGMANTVAGIGSLRTHAGDAHGQAAGTALPEARIARLAVHAAAAVSEFLIRTWQDQSRTTTG
jgi:Abortive infection C-terminus